MNIYIDYQCEETFITRFIYVFGRLIFDMSVSCTKALNGLSNLDVDFSSQRNNNVRPMKVRSMTMNVNVTNDYFLFFSNVMNPKIQEVLSTTVHNKNFSGNTI